MEDKLIPIRAEDKIPLKEKLAFGWADSFGGGGVTLISVLILVFMTDALGINPSYASAVIFLSKFWDAVSDPLMGVISDNTRSKWGRRKPYLVLGGLLVIPSFLLLFMPIGGWNYGIKIVFVTFSYLFYSTAATIIGVPYSSMSTEVSSDHRERTSQNTIRLIFSMISSGICYLIPTMLFEKFQKGEINITTFYIVIALGFGTLFAVPVIVAGIYAKERVPFENNEKSSFSFKSYLTPFKVKSFVLLLLIYLLSFLCMDIISAIVIYFARIMNIQGVTVFGSGLSSIYIVAPMLVISGLMVPFLYMMLKKKSKQFVYRVGLPLYILGGLGIAFFTPQSKGEFLILFAVMMGVGVAGCQMMPWIMFPDAIDVAELKLGNRPTGSFSGVMTFCRKVSSALSILIIGQILNLSGYIETTPETVATTLQPNSVLIAVKLILGLSIGILITTTFIISLKYKITSSKLERIRYFLEKQRTYSLDTLTSEEVNERQALIDELG